MLGFLSKIVKKTSIPQLIKKVENLLPNVMKNIQDDAVEYMNSKYPEANYRRDMFNVKYLAPDIVEVEVSMEAVNDKYYLLFVEFGTGEYSEWSAEQYEEELRQINPSTDRTTSRENNRIFGRGKGTTWEDLGGGMHEGSDKAGTHHSVAGQRGQHKYGDEMAGIKQFLIQRLGAEFLEARGYLQNV